jgi:excisionase family DNA binding protein
MSAANTHPAGPSRLDDLPPFLTVGEAAAVLRLGRTACYDAIARGQLPSVRFGRKLRVPRGALAQLAREQLVRSDPEQTPDQQEPAGGGTEGHAADQD